MRYLLWLLFSYRGRINRKTFLICFCIWFMFISYVIDTINRLSIYSPWAIVIISLVIFLIYLIVPLLVKRLHDVGESPWSWLQHWPWYVNIARFPLRMIYLFFICIFIPGDEGENKYGPPPE